MKKSSNSLVPLAARVLPESLRTCDTQAAGPANLDDAIGSRVVRGWRAACAGLRSIVEFGALLIEVETWLKKRGGPYKQGGERGGLKAWLAENAPEVDYKTAMGYKYAASGLLALADKARNRPLLVLMGEQPLSDAEEEAAREQVLSLVASSSLRLLKAAAKAAGPSRDPSDRDQGRHPKRPLTDKEIAVQAAALQADPELAAKELEDLLSPLLAWANGRAGFGALPDRNLASARARLSDLLCLADEALAARKAGKGAAK